MIKIYFINHLNKMKFFIKAINDEVKDMYNKHGTFHDKDSGLDLFTIKDITIKEGETKLVDLGVQCQLQDIKKTFFTRKVTYHSYLMFPRSSISKTPLRLANSVGLIDSGYTGTLKMAIHNTGDTPFTLKKGERYVQLARADLGPISFKLVEDLGRTTTRGGGGFGSTN
jgi:dUTP pyrophosphatase